MGRDEEAKKDVNEWFSKILENQAENSQSKESFPHLKREMNFPIGQICPIGVKPWKMLLRE